MRYLDQDDALFRSQTRADLLRLRNLEQPANPVQSFTATPLPNSFGATIEFKLGPSVAGCQQVNVMRNGVNDLSSAICLQTYPLTAENAGGDFQFIDSDQALLAGQFYWAQTIPLPERAGLAQVETRNPIVSGPVGLSALNANLLPPDAISDWGVSLGAGSNGIQLLCVNFAVPSDPNFGSCQIHATGYLGDTNEVIVAQGLASPFSFTMSQTGETVTLTAFATSKNGINASSGPAHTITLNGTETAPAKLENVTVTVIATGVQVDFDAGLEADVTSFKVYRGPHGSGFGSATPKTTIPSTGSRHYTYLDTTGISDAAAGAYFDYFATAVNPIGESSASAAASAVPPLQNMDQIGQGATYFKVPQFSGREIVLSNANFEASASILPPPGWLNPSSLSLSYETASPSQGNRSLKITSCPQNSSILSEQKWPCTAGDQFFISASMKGDGTSSTFAKLLFLDKAGSILSSVAALGGSPTSASFNVYENSGTAPANSVSCQVALGQSAVSSSSCWFDDIHAIRASNLDNELQDGTVFRRLKYVDGNNTISVSTGLNPQGSIVPGQAVTVTVGLAPTTLTITWSAQTILRADNSTISVPASGGSPIVYSGLSNSTGYNIYLYVLAATGVLTSASPNPPSTTPNDVTAAQAASDGRYALKPIQATTQSGGGTGGSGGGDGGGGGTCPEGRELVEVERFEGNIPEGRLLFSGQIKAIEVKAGDFIKGWCFAESKDIFRQVIMVRHAEIAAWRIVQGHKVSPCEPIWVGGAWVPAFKVPGALFDGTLGTRCDLTVASDDYNESNYWLVGGEPLLIHNGIVLPC